MSVVCPNCGQEAEWFDCEWCHYPLVSDQPAGVTVAQPKEKKAGGKRGFSWVFYLALGLLMAGFAFLRLSDDYHMYLVKSESMTPYINMGDMVVAGPLDGEVKPGMIITYKFQKGLVTHRVVSIDGERITTKGDSAEDPDVWAVKRADIEGVFLFKIPFLGYIPHFIQSRTGWFLAIIVPTFLLIGLLVKDIVKEAFSTV